MTHLEPRAGVDEVRERERVRLREPEVGERLELVVDLFGHARRDPVRRHPRHQPGPEPFHLLDRALRPHRASQLIRLRTREPGDVDGHLHELLLEQRHALGLGQRLLQQGVQVGDLLATPCPVDVRVHRAALDGPGPDQGDLDDDVVELPGLQARQRRHLRAGLHLEHPHGVRRTQQVVDRRVLLRQRVQPELDPLVLAHQHERHLQRRQHAEPQQVELHQPGIGAVVLVPLQHGAARHPRPLHGAHLDDGAVAHHHAARVDPQVPGQAQEPLREIDHRRRDLPRLRRGRWPVRGHDVAPVLAQRARGGVGRRRPRRRRPVHGPPLARRLRPFERAPALDALAPGILLSDVVAERPRGVAHRRPGPVGDHVGHLGGVPAPEPGVDVLDDLLTPARLDVHVDVRRPVPLRGEESLEQQPVPDGVDRGHPEGVADRGVRGGSAALAEDAVVPAERRQVVHHEEVALEAEGLDDVELMRDLGVRAGHTLGVGRAVTLQRPAAHELAQPARLVVTGRHGVRRQVRRDEREVEGTLGGQLRRGAHSLRVTAVPGEHLPRRPQVAAGTAWQPAVHVLQARPGTDGGERCRQVGVGGRRVVDVARSHQRQPGRGCDLGEGVVAVAVPRVAGVGDLDRDVVPPEEDHEAIELGARRSEVEACRRVPAHGPLERVPDGALAAAGEHEPLPGRGLGQLRRSVAGRPLRPRGQVRVGDRRRQGAVPVRTACEHEQVGGPRVGNGRRRVEDAVGVRQVQLGTEDRRQPDLARSLGEADDAVQPVVVGQGERAQPEALGLVREVLGLAGAVEKAERRVCVQLGVGALGAARTPCALSHRAHPGARRRRAGRAARPGRRRGSPGGTPDARRRRPTTVARWATARPSR